MMLPVVHSGQLLFEEPEHGIYSLLPGMKAGLLLDIGAAAGYYTRLMLQLSPESRVIAFEPFPGNFPHYEKCVGSDQRVSLVRKAVSDKAGEVRFYVSSVVSGTEPGWTNMVGYSSAGRMVDSSHPRFGDAMTVQACRLDDVVGEHVRFCKIDVQGGELKVLNGAAQLIALQGVDVFVVEFNGEEETLDYLFTRDYVFFDSRYLLIATKRKPDPSEWHAISPVAPSTGVEAYFGWAKNAPHEFRAYCEWLRDQGKQFGGVYTDMVCVHRSFLPSFLVAAAKALASSGSSAGSELTAGVA